MRLVKFGSVLLPEEDGEDSYGHPSRSALVALQGGAFDQDGGSAHSKSRSVTRKFVVVDSDDYSIQEKIDELESEFDQGCKVLKAITRDDEYRQTFAKVSDVQYTYAPGDIGQQPCTTTFECSYPRWMSSDDEPIYLNNGYLLDGTWDLDNGNYEAELITASPHDFTITVPSGVRIPRGHILIAPRAAASVEGITIFNDANDMEMAYSGEIVAGEQLVIWLLPKSVELDGDNAYNEFSIPDEQADWMTLETGDNDITITIDTVVGSTDFYWQWSRHYK